MSLAEMTDEQLHAEVTRIEAALALAERDPDAFLCSIDPELAAHRHRLTVQLAAAEKDKAALEAEAVALGARIEKLSKVRVMIGPAPGAQWTPPPRGKA